ncbi:MAG: GNAT family N-acetyltransferase, partial [Saprospiraceae bacterium]|nr:GNAT family N-acetyltransferase [Saprospiraceae bacterium]
SFKAFRENIHKPRGWSFKTWFADRVAMHALVCGNLIITGEHGFRFVSSIDSTHRIQIVHAAMKEIFRSLKKDYPDLQLFFIKEQSDIGDQSAGDFLVNQGFYRFHVQPKMIFKVNDSWLRMDDYLDGLKSKYRLRMKRAKARLQPIQAVNLDQDKIEKEHQVIFELFQQVVDEADFHMVDLLPEYFVRLKENMGDAFQMRAYYLEGQMIGFISYLEDNESLYAHFTGFRRNLNESHDLYLNILLDLIETSIEKKLTILDLSRTALEIKSSVGAVPHRMLGYLKHDRPFYNFLLSRIFTFFYPGKAWNQRNPFKAIS